MDQGGGVAALFPFDINVWYGTPAQAAAVDDWADDNYDHTGLGFIGGTTLQPHTEMHPIEAASMDTFGQAPHVGVEMESVHPRKCRALGFGVSPDLNIPL